MNEKKIHVYFKCLNWQKNTINVNNWLTGWHSIAQFTYTVYLTLASVVKFVVWVHKKHTWKSINKKIWVVLFWSPSVDLKRMNYHASNKFFILDISYYQIEYRAFIYWFVYNHCRGSSFDPPLPSKNIKITQCCIEAMNVLQSWQSPLGTYSNIGIVIN